MHDYQGLLTAYRNAMVSTDEFIRAFDHLKRTMAELTAMHLPRTVDCGDYLLTVVPAWGEQG